MYSFDNEKLLLVRNFGAEIVRLLWMQRKSERRRKQRRRKKHSRRGTRRPTPAGPPSSSSPAKLPRRVPVRDDTSIVRDQTSYFDSGHPGLLPDSSNFIRFHDPYEIAPAGSSWLNRKVQWRPSHATPTLPVPFDAKSSHFLCVTGKHRRIDLYDFRSTPRLVRLGSLFSPIMNTRVVSFGSVIVVGSYATPLQSALSVYDLSELPERGVLRGILVGDCQKRIELNWSEDSDLPRTKRRYRWPSSDSDSSPETETSSMYGLEKLKVSSGLSNLRLVVSSCSRRSSLSIWDIDSCERRMTMSGVSSMFALCSIRSFHQVPNHENELFVGAAQPELSRVDIEKRSLVSTLRQARGAGIRTRIHSKDVWCLGSNQEAGLLFSGSTDGYIAAWDLDSNCLVASLGKRWSDYGPQYYSLCVHGHFVLAGTKPNGEVCVFDIRRMGEVRNRIIAHSSSGYYHKSTCHDIRYLGDDFDDEVFVSVADGTAKWRLDGKVLSTIKQTQSGTRNCGICVVNPLEYGEVDQGFSNRDDEVFAFVVEAVFPSIWKVIVVGTSTLQVFRSCVLNEI